MPRPCLCRRIQACPKWDYFAPRGVSDRELEQIALTLDELEAIRLTDLEGLYQEQAAGKMNISRQTLGNIVTSAHRKIADFLVNGKILKIDGGKVQMMKRCFTCTDCQHEWLVPCGTDRPMECPVCKSVSVHRSPEDRGGKGRHRCGQGHGRCQENAVGRAN
jgi:uncharacterized protein